MKANWHPVEDMDDELTGEHLEYCRKFTNEYGESYFCWLDKCAEGKWEVSVGEKGCSHSIRTVATCATLTSAKRYAARYILKYEA